MKVVAGLLFLLLFSRTQSKAQQLSDHAATSPDISAPAVETALRVLESADWETRSAGFYRLIKCLSVEHINVWNPFNRDVGLISDNEV